MFSIGIDIGSRTAKAVALKDGEIAGYIVKSTGWTPEQTAREIIAIIRHQAGVDEQAEVPVCATGYGRDSVPGVTKSVTEITCHARGAVHTHPETATIIDIGGQDAKVISVDPSGFALDFVMNDRCAAGTGRFLEFMALSMEVSVEEFARSGVKAPSPSLISSMCTVFAESEMLSLISSGAAKSNVVAGLHRAIAKRVGAMVNQVGLKEPILFAGGVALNPAMLEALQDVLSADIIVPENPVINGAVGAALLANGN